MSKNLVLSLALVLGVVVLAGCQPTITVEPGTLAFLPPYEAQDLTLTASEGTIEWSAATDDAWLEIGVNSGPATTDGRTLAVSIIEDNLPDSKAQIAAGSITISPQNGAADVTVTVTVGDVDHDEAAQALLQGIWEGTWTDNATDDMLTTITISDSSFQRVDGPAANTATITSDKEGTVVVGTSGEAKVLAITINKEGGAAVTPYTDVVLYALQGNVLTYDSDPDGENLELTKDES